MTTDALVTKLKAHLATLGDGRDCRSDIERAEWVARSTEVQGHITGLMNPNLDKPQRLLADAEARRAAVVEKQAEIEQAIADAPDWESIGDGRERDKAYDRQANLHRQLQMLRDGTLYTAPGVCYERLDYLDTRIRELTQRRDDAQSMLDCHVRDAEQLLGETVSS